MANTTTIKQRFMDILFENEKEEEINKPIKNKKEAPKVEQPSIKASDLLYAKKQEKQDNHNGSSETPFINLVNEPKKKPSRDLFEEEPYSATPNLSPIFGEIENKKKTKAPSKKETQVDYSAIQKPKNDYLGMVLSPIFGYDDNAANEQRENLVKGNKKTYKDQDVTADLGDLFETYEYRRDDLSDRLNTINDQTIEINLFDEAFKEKK